MEDIYVGIDAHPSEHTAVAINRFEDEYGTLRFDNSREGIYQFTSWLSDITKDSGNVIVGVEGGGGARYALVCRLAREYDLYEVNPLFTKQRRTLGTRPDKSDPADAKLIAEVLTRKLEQLPRIKSEDLSTSMLSLKKTVWFYESVTYQATSVKNQLHQLERELSLAVSRQEKDILGFILKSRKQELGRIVKVQAVCKGKLETLLDRQGANLTTIKGVSTVTAAKIIAHSGGIERFSNLDAFIRYSGLSPKEKSSGKNKKHVRATLGNRHLNATFYMLSVGQLMWNKRAKEYFDKKVKEGKTKKHALRCLMKRTACIVYGMLRNNQAYCG